MLNKYSKPQNVTILQTFLYIKSHAQPLTNVEKFAKLKFGIHVQHANYIIIMSLELYYIESD